MEITSLRDLFEDHICDLYSVEQQILDAMPDMIDAATDAELVQALQHHAEQTARQQERLEQIGRMLDFSCDGKKCEAMKGILKEGSHLIERDVDEEDVMDAAIIAAAQRVEHYEIAVYGTARTFARMLGEDAAVSLLEETLQEEKDADVLMTKIAEAHVNRRAMAGGD